MRYHEAICKAIADEMAEDSSILMFGEDIRSNLYNYTDKLLETFGEERIVDIPLAEAGVVGAAAGMAMCGLRPIVDLTISNFLYVAMDQIANMIAKMQYMYNGNYQVPVTLMCSNMYRGGNACQHSDRNHGLFMHFPGLKVICPATPNSMYWMLREAIRDNNPVICFSDRTCFSMEGKIEPKFDAGKNAVFSYGYDVTIVAISGAYRMVTDSLEQLRENGITPEIVVVESLCPLDMVTIIDSLKRTGKLIICDTDNRTGSAASEIAARVVQNGFEYLKKEICIIAAEDFPVPFEKHLEEQIVLTKDKIASGVIDFMQRGRPDVL